MSSDPIQFYQRSVNSRLMLGTALYPSPQIMKQAIRASGAEIITASVRRQNPQQQDGESFWNILKTLDVHILPNTAGCHSAREAITMAQMSREIFDTPWIKLEVIGNDYTLQPDPFELLEASKQLINEGFEVFPYCTEDLILCQKLVDAGCKVLMPWGAPIGSGQGLNNPRALKQLRTHFKDITMIIDAGIGKPSHACDALEMGYDGVLLNTAVAEAVQPPMMASAFSKAVKAGREAYLAGLMLEREQAQPSTTTVGTPFWHNN